MTVLLPTARDLRQALARHTEAVGRDDRSSTPETLRAREDSAYTLCVLTGTTDVEDALRAADTLLAARAAAPVTALRPVAAGSAPDVATGADRALPAAA